MILLPVTRRPTPDQLSGWLADGKSVLLAMAGAARLRDAVVANRLTPTQKRRLLGRIILTTRAKLVSISTWLVDHLPKGLASLGDWFNQFSRVLAPSLYAGVMAMLGSDLAPANIKSADDQVSRQVAFLGRFRDDIRSGAQPIFAKVIPTGPENPKPPLLPSGRFLARTAMYADAAWSVAENVNRSKMQRDGYTLERRVLGSEHSCSECPRLAALGWQPVGTLPAISETPCRSHCRCSFVYSFKSHVNHVASLAGVVHP